MLRRRAFLCVGLALLLCARGVRAGEAPPPFIDPVEVAGLLLSPEDDDRERGVELLLARLGQGGDVGPFLRAMAAAQALVTQGQVPAEGLTRETLLERTRAYRQRLVEAKVRIEAEALDARARAADEAAEALATETAAAAAAAATDAANEGDVLEAAPPVPAPLPRPPAQAAQAETTRAMVSVSRVPRAEYDAWSEKPPTAGMTTGREAEAFLEAARGLPGATVTVPAAPTALGPDPSPIVRPDRITYRQGVRRTKGGAYALRSGEIDTGLRVLASAIEWRDGLFRIQVQVRYTDVPQPLPVTRIRPAADVEAIEVDSPEWRTASAERWHQASAGEMATFVFSDVVPDEVVLVGVHLRP